jgi:hypothetical protein
MSIAFLGRKKTGEFRRRRLRARRNAGRRARRSIARSGTGGTTTSATVPQRVSGAGLLTSGNRRPRRHLRRIRVGTGLRCFGRSDHTAGGFELDQERCRRLSQGAAALMLRNAWNRDVSSSCPRVAENRADGDRSQRQHKLALNSPHNRTLTVHCARTQWCGFMVQPSCREIQSSRPNWVSSHKSLLIYYLCSSFRLVDECRLPLLCFRSLTC